MNTSEYKTAAESARRETEKLLTQRAAIDARLNQLKKTIEGLNALLGEETDGRGGLAEEGNIAGVSAEVGITDAIRQLLRGWHGALSPTQIRDRLQLQGYDTDSYASVLAVIHNTLKRLEKQGEVTLVKTRDGITAYAFPRKK